jgi:hypothetical protein
MRVFGFAAASLVLLASTPASAVGLGDLAKVVLNGSSVLKKGEQKCGSAFGLTRDEDLSLTFARSAAERALPLSEFMALDTSAKASAETASTSPTFCDTTKKEKKGIVGKVKSAGKKLLTKKILG